jgi:hypothetical protein
MIAGHNFNTQAFDRPAWTKDHKCTALAAFLILAARQDVPLFAGRT